jgi:hypothetical protein
MFTIAVAAIAAALAAHPAAPADVSAPTRSQPYAALYTEPADLYVSPSGSDEGACTKASPCKSFDHAYQVAGPGDVIEAAGGSYPSQTFTAKSGAQRPYVVVREAVGQRAIVGDRGATDNCIAFEGASYVVVAGFETPYVRVQGDPSQCGVSVGREGAHHVDLIDLDVGGAWIGADDVQVLGSDIGPNVNQGGTPTAISGDDNDDSERVLFQGNTFHDYTSVDGYHQQCFAAWSGRHIALRNNDFYNCETFHIWLVAESGQTIADYLIEGNIFTQPDGSISISSTVKVGDHGGVLERVVLRENRVLADEMYVLQGYDEGGRGNISIVDNKTTEPISIGSLQDCMEDATYTPRPGLTYACRGNTRVGMGPHPPPA